MALYFTDTASKSRCGGSYQQSFRTAWFSDNDLFDLIARSALARGSGPVSGGFAMGHF
jgi:hypothetical protein